MTDKTLTAGCSRLRGALPITAVVSVFLASVPAHAQMPASAQTAQAPATNTGSQPAASPAGTESAPVTAETLPAQPPLSSPPLAPPASPEPAQLAPTSQPPAASGDATGAALQTELAAEQAVSEADAATPKLSIYGFADFTYARRFDNRSNNFVGNRLPSFYVGNFNVYLGGELGRWRSLSEVRFTYLPDGAASFDATGQSTRVSNAYPDYADYYRTRKVGGVMIERVWLEYQAHPQLTIRGGQFLTPYGIWNVDHGSPVVIGVTRPYIVGNEWFPAHQTGLEIYGKYGIDSTQLGYHLTLSNGRGPADSYEDLDKNKAVGWRLWVKHDGSFGTITAGTSGYRGRYTDSSQKFSPTGAVTFPVAQRYDEFGLALDLKWTWGGYLLQGEALMHDIRYDDRARPPSSSFFPPVGFAADDRLWGYYVITGYRLPWMGIMPFIGNQYQFMGKGNAFTCLELNGGVNIRPNEIAVLKLVALWVWRPEPLTFTKSEGQLMAQAAWSF